VDGPLAIGGVERSEGRGILVTFQGSIWEVPESGERTDPTFGRARYTDMAVGRPSTGSRAEVPSQSFLALGAGDSTTNSPWSEKTCSQLKS